MAALTPDSGQARTVLDQRAPNAGGQRLDSQRLVLVEVGRGLAACCIVGHHLSAYGEQSDLAVQAAPALIHFLYDYGRMAVQVFLVFSGFSLAWMVGDLPVTWRRATLTLGWRYVRLTVPFFAATALLLATAWLTAGSSLKPPLIESFSWGELLANLFYVQQFFGYESFAAGMWYLSIDLQFSLLFLALAAAVQSASQLLRKLDARPTLLAAVLIPLGACSAWHWNRDPAGDMLVFYFLGSLVLGTLSAWTLRRQIHWSLFLVYLLVVSAALLVDFRLRLCVAMTTAILLVVGSHWTWLTRLVSPLMPLGRISYSLFLIHYLVNWLVLAALGPVVGADPQRALWALGVAFVASLLAGTALYVGVERPALAWAKRFKP